MGSRCLSDSSVFSHDIIHVKHFKDLVFCNVDAREVFVETILGTKTVFKDSKQYNKSLVNFFKAELLLLGRAGRYPAACKLLRTRPRC